MKRLMKLGAILILSSILFTSGCSVWYPQVKTIYVPEGDAVMLRQDVSHVDIWAKTKDQDPVAGNMTLKEGWM
jgi:hypothetical protein